MKFLSFTMAIALSLLVAQRANSATITLFPSKDNTIYLSGDLDDEIDNSNGQGNDFGAGIVSGGRVRRALLQFDLPSSLVGAQINDVTLRLRLFQVSGSSTAARDFSLHRLTSNWGEGSSDADGVGGGTGTGGGSGIDAEDGDATWIYTFFDTASWTSLGGDFVAGASATRSVATTLTSYDWTGAGLLADVQAWLNGGASNFGWLLKSSDESLAGGRRFYSRQYTDDVSFQPQLIINYVPEPASLNLIAAAFVSGWFSRRRLLRRNP